MLITMAELAASVGVTIETVRQYERVGLITLQIVGRIHRYRKDARLRILLVEKGRRLGFGPALLAALRDDSKSARDARRQRSEQSPVAPI